MNQWVVEFGQSDELVTRIYAGGDDAVKAIRDYATECKAYCRSLVAFAKSVEPRWIPVEERLPEEGVRVLVCNIYGGSLPNQGDTGYVVDNGVIEDEEWCIPDDPFFHVTHWMPLPEPPEVK